MQVCYLKVEVQVITLAHNYAKRDQKIMRDTMVCKESINTFLTIS